MSQKAAAMLHGQEQTAHGDAGFQGLDNQADANPMAYRHTPVQAPCAGQEQCRRCEERPSTEDHVRITSQGRTSVLGDQTTVWVCENALPWIEEEHGAIGDAFYLIQFVAVAQTVDGSTGMSTPKTGKVAYETAKTGPKGRNMSIRSVAMLKFVNYSAAEKPAILFIELFRPSFKASFKRIEVRV